MDKTPQEMLIETAEKNLNTLDEMFEYWNQKKKITTGERRKTAHLYRELLRDVINEYTSKLLTLKNHIAVAPEVDARDKYIEQVEAENKAKGKKIAELEAIIAENQKIANSEK